MVALTAGLLAGGPVQGSAQSPDQVASRFASAWHREQPAGVRELFSADGVRLNLESEGYGGVATRRVLAALESYWGDWVSTSVEVRRVSQMAEEPDRAYGELAWHGSSEVTGEAFEATIFLGLTRTDAGWRIDELRTIRPR